MTQEATEAVEIPTQLPIVDYLRIGDDPHLAAQLGPTEGERRTSGVVQLDGLVARVVGEEHEATVVDPLQQHVAGRRPAIGGNGAEDHGVGLPVAGSLHLAEPTMELGDRVGRQVGLVEAHGLVGLAYPAEVHPGSQHVATGSGKHLRCIAPRP